MVYWYKYRNDLYKRVDLYVDRDSQIYHDRRTDSVGKLENNIRRAARKIEDYALCNDWQWFGTFTLNPAYRDRADLDLFREDFTRFIRNQRRDYGSIAFLLVPELHRAKDGWHMHGLLNDLSVEALRAFSLSERLPYYMRDKISNGNCIFDWPAYRARFGFCDLEPLRNRDAASRYISKYIVKAEDSTAQELALGKHLYFISRGLNQPERIAIEKSDEVVPDSFPVGNMVFGKHYNFDYGSVQWFEKKD